MQTHIHVSNPASRAGCDTWSIFKRSLIGLNSEISFTLTGYHNKVKEPLLPYYFKVNFQADYGWFQFRLSILFDRLPFEETSLPNYWPIKWNWRPYSRVTRKLFQYLLNPGWPEGDLIRGWPESCYNSCYTQGDPRVTLFEGDLKAVTMAVTPRVPEGDLIRGLPESCYNSCYTQGDPRVTLFEGDPKAVSIAVTPRVTRGWSESCFNSCYTQGDPSVTLFEGDPKAVSIAVTPRVTLFEGDPKAVSIAVTPRVTRGRPYSRVTRKLFQ